MIDFILSSPQVVMHFCESAIFVLGLFALLLIVAPLSMIERKYSIAPQKGNSRNIPSTVAACLTAWFLDAAIFAIPAMVVIEIIFFLLKGLCMDPQQYIPDCRDDLTGTPANILLKCFLAALNPFWFFCLQIANLNSTHQPVDVDPYTNSSGQLLRICAELLLPLILFYFYTVVLSSSKLGASVGTIIINFENENSTFTSKRNPLSLKNVISTIFFGLPHILDILKNSSVSTYSEPANNALLCKGRNNRLFALAVLFLLLISISQIFTMLEQIRRVNSQACLAIERFLVPSSQPLTKCTAALCFIQSFRFVSVRREKADCLNLLEKVAASQSNSLSILKDIQKEKQFINTGNSFGYIRKVHPE